MTTASTATIELLQDLNKLWANYEMSISALSQEIDKLWIKYEACILSSIDINNVDNRRRFIFANLSDIQNQLKKLIDETKSVTNDTQITGAVIKRAYSLYDAVNASICDTGFVSCR